MSETTSNEQVLTELRFDAFELDERIMRGLAEAGFEFCTPIQAKTLPPTLAGHDVAGLPGGDGG